MESELIILAFSFVLGATGFYWIKCRTKRKKFDLNTFALPWAVSESKSGLEKSAFAIHDEILEGKLWQTGWKGNVDIEKLKQLGITGIINLAVYDFQEATREKIKNLYDKAGIESKVISIDDSRNSADEYEEILDELADFIYEQPRVSVNCFAGVSRASTATLYYLMKYEKIKLLDGFIHLKSKRPIIAPNFGFMKMLVRKEKKLFGENSITQEEIDSVAKLWKDDYLYMQSKYSDIWKSHFLNAIHPGKYGWWNENQTFIENYICSLQPDQTTAV